MKRFQVTCLFVFIALFAWTQPHTKSIDSLKQVVSTTNIDTVKYNAWLKLSELYLESDTALSLTCLQTGLDNARLQKNSLYETEFLSQLGSMHFMLENNDSALYYLTVCISKFDNNTPARLKFDCYMQLGNAYWKKGDFQKSMQALLKAENYTNPPDEALKRSRLYYTMGGVMMDLQQPEKALEYCNKCISVLEQNNLTRHLSKNYSSCGALFFMLGKPAEALALFNKALALAIKFDDSKSYTQATMNLGNYYNEMDDLDSALYFYNLSRNEHLKNMHTDQQYASLLLNIASALDQQKKYNEAELLYFQADSLAMKFGFTRTKLSTKKYLAILYTHMGQWEKAYRTLEKYNQLKDSITNEESNKNTLELEQKFNVSQKEKEIELLQKDNEKQQVIKNAFISVFVLTGIIGLILFFGFRNRGRLNKQLAEKNKIIHEERNRAIRSEQFKQQFLANMSHELRSPMNAVLGGVNLALQQNDLSVSRKYLETAQRSSKNLLGIINDILDLSKIEAGKLSLESIIFNIYQATQDVILAQSIQLKTENQKLVYDGNVAIDCFVKGDPLRYMQVLTNLINNAIKFTPKGTITVCLNYEVLHEVFKVSVSDEGIGMTTDQLENLFMAYNQTTTATARKYGGTGLGLAITKELVDLMKGTVVAESIPHKGSTFSITLPFEQTTSLPETDSDTNVLLINQLKKTHLIIVDDLVENLQITHDLLKNALIDVRLTTFTNGKDLVDYLHTHPDLSNTCILTDLDMPIMNGFEATRIIRNELKLTIPIIALTASIFIGDEAEFKQAGFNGMVIKPFITIELIKVIAKTLT